MTTGKVMPVERAIETVAPGMWLHFSLNEARPNAAIRALVARFRGSDARFTLSATGFGGPILNLLLVALGMSERVVTGFIGHQYPSPGPSRMVQTLEREGRLSIEAWSLLSLLQRLRAGAMGQEWMPTGSLAQTTLIEERGDDVRRLEDGLTLVRALRPDVTFLHGLVADDQGNTLLASPSGEALLGAAAARQGAIVTVEEVVSRHEIRRLGGLSMIPGALVRSVSECRFGSHPAGLYGPPALRHLSYGDDYDYIAESVTALESSRQELEAWVDERVVGSVDSAEGGLRAVLGTERLDRLQAWESWSPPRPASASETTPTRSECMAVLGARHLATLNARSSPSFILTGIGVSSLAAWLAKRTDPDLPPLISEVGFYDYEPVDGNPFLFYFPNLGATSGLTDTETILGMLVQGHGDRCLAMLAAAQVDSSGNINTSRTERGWITGSGGANDIAAGSHRNVVLIPHEPGRLVERVQFVTSAGRNVVSIVTDRAVFERDPAGGEFVLSAVLGNGGQDRADDVVAEALAATPWAAQAARSVEVVGPPTVGELQLLRSFDPHRDLLGS